MIAFVCEGDQLVGTVDEADGVTGILVVSGGNEVRCGAHRGMALLAQRLASEGVPVFRFDRRGVGDSEGKNGGYASAVPDIAAALSVFRCEQPQVTRVIGFGNCDAATALLSFDSGCDSLVLANPWLGDEAAPPPPAAVRANYARKLRDPNAWKRLFQRGLPFFLGSLRVAANRRVEQPLERRIAAALRGSSATIVLAADDRTAQIFAASTPARLCAKIVKVSTASHSFAGQGEALVQILLEAVALLDDKAVS